MSDKTVHERTARPRPLRVPKHGGTSFLENLRMSVRSIAANGVRSFLTALGVMIGVAAVIALVAIGNGAQLAVQQSLEQLGSNLLIVYSGQPRGSALVRRNTTNIKPTLTAADLEVIAALPETVVRAVAPESNTTVQVKYENRNASVTVIGTTESYPAVRNFHPVHGAFFSTEDVDQRRSVAVIGMQVYRDLFTAGTDPLEQRIRINGVAFRVVGVMQEKGNSTQDNAVLIPMSAYQRTVSGESAYGMINVQAAAPEVMRDLQHYIETEILRLHRLPSMEAADFYIANQLDLLSSAQGVAGTFTVLLAGIAAISLVVGGIGIMNIMLVSVTERTREIGVRMALGARGRDIMWQFLTEAVILSVAGGFIGVALGVGTSYLAESVWNVASVVSLDSVAMAFGFAFVTGLFFGGYPAWRASRLDPIEALRYE